MIAAEEVAGIVLWLLSREAAAVTGETWGITGGELPL